MAVGHDVSPSSWLSVCHRFLFSDSAAESFGSENKHLHAASERPPVDGGIMIFWPRFLPFQMCSDYEKSLVQPVYENDGLGPRALPETHPLLQDWQVRSRS